MLQLKFLKLLPMQSVSVTGFVRQEILCEEANNMCQKVKLCHGLKQLRAMKVYDLY